MTAGGPPEDPEHHRSRLASLHPLTRLLLFVLGWTVVLIGIAGLVLPGIQGILTILIGAAILSLVSESVYRLLHRALERWPGLQERLDRWRHWLHDKLHRGDGPPSGSP